MCLLSVVSYLTEVICLTRKFLVSVGIIRNPIHFKDPISFHDDVFCPTLTDLIFTWIRLSIFL